MRPGALVQAVAKGYFVTATLMHDHGHRVSNRIEKRSRVIIAAEQIQAHTQESVVNLNYRIAVIQQS